MTQAAVIARIEAARRMAAALAPSQSRVLALDLDHREINHVLGDRPDRSGETRTVMRFIRAVAGRGPRR